MVLSIIFLTTYNDNESKNIINSSSSQIEISSSINVSQSQSESTNQTDEINWENDYCMPYDIKGDNIDGFDKDVVVYLNGSLLNCRLYDDSDNNGFMTISHIHNNNYTLGDVGQSEALTEEETNQYIATSNRIFTDTDNTYNILLKDYYDETSTGYSSESNTVLFRTNADWDVTPWKVTYINYDIDKDVGINQKWIDAISAVLDNETGGTDTPAIIRESWSFDYNGKTLTYINASNIWYVRSDGTILNSRYSTENNYDYNDTDIIYTLSIFMEDDKVVWYSISNDIFNVNKWTMEDTEHKNICYTFHTDKNGNIKAVPFYRWVYSERKIREMGSTYFINLSGVYDLNNDNKPDMILYNSLTGANKFTYDDGTLHEGALLYASWAASPHKYPLFYSVKR